MYKIGFDFGTDRLIRKSSEAFSCGSQYRRDGRWRIRSREGGVQKKPLA
jgi:hypothetical protein